MVPVIEKRLNKLHEDMQIQKKKNMDLEKEYIQKINKDIRHIKLNVNEVEKQRVK